jgi:hypothetical protein
MPLFITILAADVAAVAVIAGFKYLARRRGEAKAKIDLSRFFGFGAKVQS